jgi:hypothetical protein
MPSHSDGERQSAVAWSTLLTGYAAAVVAFLVTGACDSSPDLWCNFARPCSISPDFRWLSVCGVDIWDYRPLASAITDPAP